MRVVIAEDNPLLRDGIRLLLTDHGITVVSTVDNGDDLRAAVREHRPDTAVVDVRMPPTFTDEGLRAALAIRTTHPDIGVLVFSQWRWTRASPASASGNERSWGCWPRAAPTLPSASRSTSPRAAWRSM